jgi:hypothetical protein
MEVIVSVPLTVPSPSADGPEKADMPYVLSYFAQRRAAGYIGILLPPVVLVYDKYLTLGCLPGSISASYHTGIRNFLVGSLCAVGVFLISSIGYDEDKPWSIFAGVTAFLVAFCPTRVDACQVAGAPSPSALTSVIHGIAACALFLTFAYFCLVLFIQTNTNGVVVRRPKLATLPKPKRHRNIAYLVCGWIMVIAMAVFGLWAGAAKLLNITTPHHLLFAVEWVCLWAFGFAWLVKGQQLFSDVEGDTPDPEHAVQIQTVR